jgi:adenylate cyclase
MKRDATMIRSKPTRNETLRTLAMAAALGVLVYGSIALARNFGLLQPYELLAYDLGLTIRQAQPAASRYVTIIEVTEHDIAALGRWPLSDEQLSDALERIASGAPRAIGLDIYRDIEVPPGRDRLDAVLRADSRIFSVTKLADDQGPGVSAPPALVGTSQVGFNDVLVDGDGIVRRGLLFMDGATQTEYAFALRLAAKYLAADGIGLAADPTDPDQVRFGPTTVPPLAADFGGYVGVDAAGYQFLLDYAQPKFRTFAFGDLAAGRVPVEAIRGRIVLLGVAADSVKDDFYAPLGRWLWQAPSKMSGIELHAHIADQLLRFALDRQRPLSSLRGIEEHLWILFWAVAGALTGLAAPSARRLGWLWSLGSISIAAVSYGVFLAGVWVPFVPAWLGWLGATGLVTAYLAQSERRERQVLHELFSTHVSADLANLLWQRRGELIEHGALKPQSVTATTLFVDLRGFTSISERLLPDDLMQWLNRALEAFTRTILDHDGMIDDYFGDGIKANFGVLHSSGGADPVGADARRAVACARALARVTAELNAAAAQEQTPYAIRIGIHTGVVVAGTVGSERRLKFTTVGDAVNLAARLQALDDPRLDVSCACQIIVSETTRGYLDAGLPTRALASVRLKGKHTPITVYEVVLDENSNGESSVLEALQP